MTDKELQDIDFYWFLNNTESLYKEHGSKLAVIKNKCLMNLFNDFDTALKKTLETEKLGTFIIQKIYENKNKIKPIIINTPFFPRGLYNNNAIKRFCNKAVC